MDVYLAIVGVVSFLAGAILLRNQLKRRRCRALEQEARRLRFSFTSVAKPFEGSTISELAACLQESSSIGVEQVMQGTISGRRVLVFNLRAYSSLGEGATVTTFAAFQCSASRLPVFQIRAKNIIDRCRGALGRNAVDRDIDPEFAKRFLFCCADGAKKRELFTGTKLLHLRQCAENFQIRSSPNWLLIFCPGGMIKAKNLRQFLRATSTIAFGLLDPEPQPG